jgi:hypothetical protein
MITEQLLEEDHDARELLQQEDNKGPDMRAGLIRRMQTQKRGKLPLLIGIEHDWTPRDHKSGRVYVFRHDKQIGLIKIGWTTLSSKDRHDQQGNCYAVDTTPYWQSEEPFVGAYRVEQLIQKQLHESNVIQGEHGHAHCKKRHKEWFRYNLDDAIILIKLWTEFVTGDFYDVGEGPDGKPFGKLSQKGRAFMDGVCNMSPEALKYQMKARTPGALNTVAEDAADSAATGHVGLDTGPLSSCNPETEDFTAGNDDFHDSHHAEDSGTHSDQKQEKPRARWIAWKAVKDIAKIKGHEIKSLVPEQLRRSLVSAWNRGPEAADEPHHDLASGMEEAIQTFYGVFYANEIRVVEADDTLRSQGSKEKGQRRWPFKQWRGKDGPRKSS